MIIHLKIIGVLLVLLALIHTIFPLYFNWSNDLKSLSLINRQMMKTHTFFIALTLVLMGTFCFFYSEEITSTPLGKIISLGFGIFWFLRLLFQFFVYSKELWHKKRFETSVHIFFIGLWSYLTTLFFMIFFSGKVF